MFNRSIVCPRRAFVRIHPYQFAVLGFMRAAIISAAFLFAAGAGAQQATSPAQQQSPGSQGSSSPEVAPQHRQEQTPSAAEPTPTEIPSPPPVTVDSPPPMSVIAVQNPNAPCVQPPPPVTYKDYRGPYAKTVAVFADRLQRKSVGPPLHRHYKPGALLCTLELRDRVWFFVRDSTDPVAFLNAFWNAAQSQAQDSPPQWGRGATGYLDRFGANMAGQSSAGFFKDLVYPTIFDEDPRYYRLGRGSATRRVFHAMSHVVIAHNENGNEMFNFSEWMGDASVRVLANTYMPNAKRGVTPVAISMATTMGWNMGYDVLREFWPEIAKKLRLPFREQNESPNTPSIYN